MRLGAVMLVVSGSRAAPSAKMVMAWAVWPSTRKGMSIGTMV